MLINRYILILFTTVLFQSCSQITYTTRGDIPVYLKSNVLGEVNFKVKNSVPIYFWGLYPEKSYVLLDQELSDLNLSSVTELEIYEYTSVLDWAKAIITFGLYAPRSFQLEGYGIR